MEKVYVGLGANVGDREASLRAALSAVGKRPEFRVLGVSGVYESAPFGYRDQPDFLNAAAELETEVSPREVLDTLLEIERSLGRVRGRRWGPRVIDLDLLLYGRRIIREPGLTVPHSDLHRRAFVLLPLCDLNPRGLHPVTEENFRSLARAVAQDLRIRRVEDAFLSGETKEPADGR